ncbi:MAG: diaminopimelate decarboxylase, partial [Phycisphaeraceae bacterium]|nr:diaminopimelate decarboxylase [Phycisphaeraceae bacterium]
MDWFTYQNGRLFCEQTAATDLAEQFGTPLYVYSAQTFRHHYDLITKAFGPLDPLICYSIKSCGNVHILRLLAERGAGMDVVSGGELFRALEAGVPPEKIVYAGVGKTDEEIDESLRAGIGLFNIESEAEFENIAQRAEAAGTTAHGALRINPDVADERTHAKTTTGKKETKFGVDIERARIFFATYGDHPHLKLTAVHLHIGSPIYSAEPYVRAIEKTLGLIEQLRQAGHTIDTIDIGGGYAADYESGLSPAPGLYAERIVPLLKDRGLKVILEPGRFIAGNAGILLSRVQYVKTGGAKRFAIMDSGMHHLVRPAMYEAFH